MRKSIKLALDNNLKCYAECGGLMYLTENNRVEMKWWVSLMDIVK